MSGSILSYPDRGHWGKSSWRGNASGHFYADLFKQLKPAHFVDPMVGSGTSVEVAAEMGIQAVGLDLHSGFDALTQSILAVVGRESDLVFSHPPYGAMVVYSGPGGQWGKEAHPSDLSRCVDDEDFHSKLQAVLMNQREATRPGGFYGCLIGDWRRGGVYSSYQSECIARMPRGELKAVLIKVQHNERSGSKQYANLRLPRIEHEYALLWEKPRTLMSALATLSTIANEQAQRLRGTWKAIVRTVLAALGGKASLAEIYEAMCQNAPDRVSSNQHWKEKVRQTLQLHGDFMSCERGVWALAG